MQTLAEIKNDMEFNGNLRSIIEVLKSIAITEYQAMEKRIKEEEGFFALLQLFLNFPELKFARHPFLLKSKIPPGVVVISSDRGLLGGLNLKVMTEAFLEMQENNARLIIVGEKGQALARDRKIPFMAFPGVNIDERFAQAQTLRDYLVSQVLSGKIGGVKVIYPEPVSFLVQRIRKVVLIPFNLADVISTQDSLLEPGKIILESTPSDIIEYLVALWMGHMFFSILGYSRLAELAARFSHLENGSQKIQELEKSLKLQYFKVRHSLIDRSMREIFTARSVYARE